MELVHCHLAKMPVAPHEVNPNILPAISDLILKLLAKTAEDRYQGTYGLKADLQKCLDQLNSTGTIEAFDIGQDDISDRFHIPQRLYGREQEIGTLLAVFDRVGQGATEMMLVTGYSGIGKSALIHEIQTPIIAKRGYFISGKFDQFKRNIPYSSLIQAFQELVHQILTEPEAQITLWKEQLLNALRPNGQVIIQVIPEIELIIGIQPELPELSPDKAQNRFNLVFRNFVRTFAAAVHPLVIFLDDVQWADLPSLKLIELFMTTTAAPYMLMVCAYRENEVNAAHPLMLMLAENRKAGAAVSTMTLKPLEFAHVNQLIADRLRRDLQNVRPLAEVTLQKTGGNPFFLTQFLQSLYEEGLLKFNVNVGAWEWDLDAIRKIAITDNVVELMAGKIQKLSDVTQQVLEFAASIGNQFDLDTLSIVHEKSKQETAQDLWGALQEGLIVPLDDSYKYVGIAGIGSTAVRGGNFKFLHDRVRQAAYSLIEEVYKQEIHLKIGRLMRDHTPEHDREEKIFEIVNHFNLGQDLILSQPERGELAKLNLIAGKKAKASAAYQPAYQYLQQGIALLREDDWQQQYDLALALFSEAAEAAYLSGDFEHMEALVVVVLQQAHTLLDQVHAYEVRIQAYIAQNKPLEALKMAIMVMKLLGIKFPENPGKLRSLLDLLRTKLLLIGKRIDQLVYLPRSTAPDQLTVMRIMAITGSPAYYALPNLVPLLAFKGINFSVKYGNTSFSAFVYAGYGLILCGFLGDIESGYQFGKLALSVLERFNAKEQKARVFHVVYTCITHWKEHYRNALQPLLEGYHSGLETGDLEFGCYTTATYCYLLFFTGKELTELERELAKFIEVASQFKQAIPLNCLTIYHQTVLDLLGQSEHPSYIPGKSHNEEQRLLSLLQADDRHAVFQFYFNKLLLCYLFQAYSQAIEHADCAETYLDGAVGIPCTPLYYFYDSLARLAMYPEAPESEHKRLLRRVAANQRKMKKWAQYAPMNYLHRWYPGGG